VIELPAWGKLERELSADQAAAISRSGLADVLSGDAPGSWRLQASSKIGVAVGSDWELRVQPHIEIPRLMFLLAYAVDQSGWKDVRAQFEREDDLFAAIAGGFSWHATWATEQGLLRGYLRREEQRADIRGRVLFGQQIARTGGLPLPVQVAYEDYTEDVLENRLLRTATQLLLRLPRVGEDARKRLLRLRAILDAVEPITAWRGVKAPPATRMNQRYSAALRLAELILDSASVSSHAGDISSTTFVFDMNKVFEDFVTAAFRAAMRTHGGDVRSQEQPFSLDEAGVLPVKPDLAWWLGGSCQAVLDAKYKPIFEGIMRNGDAYQMLAYCAAYGLKRGYLVYAKDSVLEGRVHAIRNLAIEIEVATIDVRKEPDALIADIETLAARVAASAQSNVASTA
jgi:5-methylcytosine-specific restriction enzyme subunit McrC